MKRFSFITFMAVFALFAVALSGCLTLGEYEDDPDDWPYVGDEYEDDDATDDDDSEEDDDDDDNDTADDDDDDDDNDTAPQDILEGVYDVTGTDDTFGDYQGQIEFRKVDKGEYEFVRLVTYSGLEFEDYDLIQTVWSGTAVLDGSDLSMELSLRRAHYVTEYNGLTRTEADATPLPVTGAFTLTDDTLAGGYSSEGDVVSIAETAVWSVATGEEPIWENQDEFYESHAEPPEWVKSLMNILLADYHDLEFYDSSRDREEFKRYVHYLPRFRSDLDFYRANQTGLRVVNKVMDDISLFETSRRADAFKYTLAEKATFFDQDTPAYTINEHGMIVEYIPGTQPIEHDYNGDSLLWTGTYVASQAYRYMVTGEQEALDNMLFSLDGVITCVEITQDPTIFARSLRTAGNEGDKGGKYSDWRDGEGPWEGIQWLNNGNNDMIHGVFYSFVLAYIALPEDSAYDTWRDRMADAAVSLTLHCPVAYNDIGNRVTMNWLSYLLTGDTAYQTAYKQYFDLPISLYTRIGNGMMYIYGVSDWSGQHLCTVNMITHRFLAELTSDSYHLSMINNGFTTGVQMIQNARQALYTIAAYGLADPGSDLEWVLEDAIWSLREMPLHKLSFNADQRISADWCASPLPSLFWKFDWATGGRHQGLYGTPAFMRETTPCWYKDNPLGGVSFSQADRYDNSADFLHAYWLGRYFGVLTGDE